VIISFQGNTTPPSRAWNDFSEVRQYQYDIRAIDWNVTARYNEAHVKVFEEERELTMMLMVDISGSESFGSKSQFKRYCYRDCRHHGFSAKQNNDKIGLIFRPN
jgi:uncharacterized protein (DUF58 family)